jgi:hypothetical protein
MMDKSDKVDVDRINSLDAFLKKNLFRARAST